MAAERPLPPVWLMGFGFLPLGVFGGIMLIAVPQLLAANHVPEPQIAAVTAVGLFAGFGSFLLAPLLDWRFSRKTYAIGLTLSTAACLVGALLTIRDLPVLTAFLFTGSLASSLCIAAVGGWFGNLTDARDKGALGAWFTVANIGSGGVTVTVAVPLLPSLPYALGAGALALLLLSVLPLFVWIGCPPADGRLAHESFRAFARDVMALLRKASVLWTLLIFLAPGASFALTNTLGGLGRDFSTSEKLVALLGGVGAVVAGVAGSLLVLPISKRIPPRPLYLLVGAVGAAFTLTMILLPRAPATFGLALMGENVFQAAAFSVGNLIILRTIGKDNPLAATQFGLLNAASILPLTYMQVIDGQAYGLGGAGGSLAADALVSGAACALLAVVLWVFRRKVPVL